MKINHLLVLVLSVCISIYTLNACTDSAAQGSEMPDVVDYNFHIRPILADNCFACHGPDAKKRQAGLRLDIAEEAYKALKENPTKHALVPRKPKQSEVYLRLITKDAELKMPPIDSKLSLTETQIEIIEKWIKQGAIYKPHWAFLAPKQAPLPDVDNEEWVSNEIDYFILEKLDNNHVKPNPTADDESLLKRLSIDLTGLPPTMQQMDAKDTYEKQVDHLLASPKYGEKMAVYWMDLARFADSHGFQDDSYRSQWPWRDWVINAFNKNMPYNTFVSMQLAGDLMPNATKEQILATAFNRNHKITEEGGIVDEEYRVSYVADRTNTFSKAFLGLTMECAACHDHKYDPFSQKNYYQLFSFFNNVPEKGIESVVGGPETYAKKPFIKITKGEVDSLLRFISKKDTNELIVSVMGELEDSIRPTYVLERGAYDKLGALVFPQTPESVLPFNSKYPKNRLGLSQWLFDKNNPLTARVFVNQIWQEFFGKGLVKTPGDFGMQGALPSHPELLDWLAVDFVNHGWDIKHLVRKIVTSATYKQSAVISKEKYEKDPENVLISRAPRFRIKAEFIRDLILASSGLLNQSIGGPSIKPYQPEGLWEGATSGRGILSIYKQDHGFDLYRRGLYSFVKRTVPPPAMTIFDASNRDQCQIERLPTNTPLQALVLMNDPTVLEASRVLGAKLLENKHPLKVKLSQAFRAIVCRKPNEKELVLLDNYYHLLAKAMTKAKAEKLLKVGEYPIKPQLDKVQLASLMQVIASIYNLEETFSRT
ncbi:MAG: PSD1 and planctomycete cytochrome C domain-containing protein [Leadbetterella sp.]|nr:PSD1 and planctomycete cytochrome C domain-containing protein [Leadbetterella sp.]